MSNNNTNIIGIVGSLRSGSVNGAAARAAINLLPDDAALELHQVAELPLYHGDEEAAGPPAKVQELRDAVRSADGIILFSPEYNGSFPAVTKNVIDWLSRDPSAWDSTGITMACMSPGPRAAASVRAHFEAIMAFQATRLYPTIGLGNYGDRIDESGEVTDAATLDELRAFIAGFVDHCREQPPVADPA